MKRTAPNMADKMADRITTHTVDLLRVDADIRRRIMRLLRQVDADVVAQLMREDPTVIRRPTFRDRRLIALAEQTRKILRTGYRGIATEHGRAMRELAELEEEFTRTKTNKIVGTEVMTVGVSEVTLREIARDTLIQGAPSRDWWAGQAQRTQKAFERQVRMGLVEGQTLSEIVQRIRGTKARNYTDGIMEVSRRDAAALVRTSVQAVANAARMETYRANDDVVNGTQWVSTLDARTTVQCTALAGASWDLNGNPFPESPFQGPDPGGPPIHWNCRSTRIARIKPLSELLGVTGPRKAARIDALPQQTRSSMDGQVAASLTFGDFLKSKPPAFADKLLGKVRAELWRKGKLPLERLIDQSARPLTLEQLKESVRSVTGKAIEKARAA